MREEPAHELANHEETAQRACHNQLLPSPRVVSGLARGTVLRNQRLVASTAALLIVVVMAAVRVTVPVVASVVPTLIITVIAVIVVVAAVAVAVAVVMRVPV